MSAPKKKAKSAPSLPRARNGQGHGRQRQRLIDACISALHIYGPSRTTVEKVVAIAKMSPGIVRFYFDSKAAMLVASLQFLAAEFEEQVLFPVAKLKSTPIEALQLLVDLYLDPEIASPRKVSVWYAFWGEASSRQEYYDICGQKDESFAALVRELIEGVIAQTSQQPLDPDGVALGLIGALEILWQDFAFQTERNIDRAAAKRRCMAFLGSVFPGCFEFTALPAGALRTTAPTSFHGWAYGNRRILALERETLLHDAWTIVGHESEIPRAGEFLAVDIGTERALIVRDAAGAIHALRNSCPRSPHALVADRHGRVDAAIECPLHGLKFSLDGRRAGSGRFDLSLLDLQSVGGLIFVRSAEAGRARAGAEAIGDAPVGGAPIAWFDALPSQALMLLGTPVEIPVAADWKVIVEQWLEGVPAQSVPGPMADSCAWTVAPFLHAGWSAVRYLSLVECQAGRTFQRRFVAPHQLLETRPDGLSVIQVLPVTPGRCVLRRLDYTVLPPKDSARAAQYLARRLGPYTRRDALKTAQSTQKGWIEFGYGAAGGAASPAVAWFRNRLLTRIPALAGERAPNYS
jgi:TetR/AcrR family transcriptional regulator, transcriptional repressor of bet genes